MLSSTNTLRRLTTALAVAAVLGGAAASQALASGGSQYQDGWYGYAVALTKASQSHAATLPDGRSPDTRDFAQAAHSQPTTIADGRSPDTRDSATLAHSPVVTITRSPGFDWGDFGIGVAAALGVMAILAVSTKLLAARNRKQPSPVATA